MTSSTTTTHARSSRARLIPGLALALLAATVPLVIRTSAVSRTLSLADGRLGRASVAVTAPGFVAEALTGAAPEAMRQAVPIIVLPGAVSSRGRPDRPIPITVYGVDDRFWRFHGARELRGPSRDEAILSAAAVNALGVSADADVSLLVPHAEDAPLSSLHGRRDEPGQTLHVRVSRQPLGSLEALSPLQTGHDRPAVYVSLSRLQESPPWIGRVNTILVAAATAPAIETALAQALTLDDVGLSVRTDAAMKAVIVESRTGLLDETTTNAVMRAALDVGALPAPVLTTLVDSIGHGDRVLAYSFVASIELQSVAADVRAEELSHPPILLNQWTASQLDARVGSAVTVAYPVWQRAGRVTIETGQFEVAGIVPLEGVAAQASLAPALPGIAGAPNVRSWQPRIPFDAARVHTMDEEYWARYGTTPKAFVPPHVGRAIWRSPSGVATSVQISPREGVSLDATAARIDAELRRRLMTPLARIHVRDLRAEWDGRARADGRDFDVLLLWSLPIALAGLLLAGTDRLGRRGTTRAAGAVAIVALAIGFPAVRSMAAGTPDGIRAASGGYALLARTIVPMFFEPLGPDGLARLGLDRESDVRVTPFRVHDAATAPGVMTAGPGGLRIASVSDAFIGEGRFSFGGSLDRSDEELANPWLLLQREQHDPSDPAAGPPDPIVPVIASDRLLRRLRRRLGEDITVMALGQHVRLRAVASTDAVVFDDALVMRESDFLQWFPATAGYLWLALDAPAARVQAIRARLEERLTSLGGHVEDVSALARAKQRSLASRTRLGAGLTASAALLALGTVALLHRRSSTTRTTA